MVCHFDVTFLATHWLMKQGKNSEAKDPGFDSEGTRGNSKIILFDGGGFASAQSFVLLNCAVPSRHPGGSSSVANRLA